MFLSTSPKAARRLAHRGTLGQSLAEFSLVFPVLLILVLGTVDYGRVYFDYVSLTNAARAGAAYASKNAETSQDTLGIEAAVLDELGDDAWGDTLVSATTGSDADGNLYTEVTVRHTFQTLVPWPGLPDNVDVERSVRMRVSRD